MAADLQLYGDSIKDLRMFLTTHLSPDQLSQSKFKKLLYSERNDVLTPSELRQVWELISELRALNPSTPTLMSFLRQGRGVQVRVEAKEQLKDEQDNEKKTKYLASRRRKLQRLDEEMRYSSMVRNVKTRSVDKELLHHQTNIRQHLSIGANMVMARLTAFIAVYFLARNLTQNETTRLVAGLVGAIFMMIIEMILFITRAAKIESIEHESKKQKSVF
ncbi:ATPase, vacuolar ER assembly factor, Vma12 [Plasmopara halstedii]|uniref:ATPase, vacuolar ER assembly factor, Vma12 n=1 Tax=Plasmopara halstedii TaxID=4781 RepID=A0A0P1A7H8_PLAHL|nr:ATPase, vacuolar ER assembly factor, Vma12 [Plasmopara halstedii]CEG36148.1 ATPase, vacuolar ER assembly factor, Vma12 [Plasmopara halstedii]|eukprot:XP_024572517.1 ATPase, vacuolar ER assembly factor, Vma12 [Plasmopara halstedii]